MKLSIRSKLLGGFGAVLALMALVGWSGYNSANRINHMLNEVYLNETESIAHVKEANVRLASLRAALRATVMAEDSAEIEAEAQRVKNFDAELRAQLAEFERLIQKQEVRQAFQAALASYEAYRTGVDHVVTLARQNQDVEARKALKELRAKADAVDEQMGGLSQMKDAQAKETYEEGSAVFLQSRNLIAGVILAALLLGAGIALWLSRGIAHGAKQMVQAARQIVETDLAHLAEATEAMADGDLTCSVELQTQPLSYRSRDEIGDLAQAFNAIIARLRDTGQSFAAMTGKLREALGQVQEGATHLAAAAQQINAAAEQSAQATQQVAATIQQVAQGAAQQTQSATQASTQVEQMAQTAEDIARGAQEQAAAVRAYPNNPAARKAIKAQAKCKKAM